MFLALDSGLYYITAIECCARWRIFVNSYLVRSRISRGRQKWGIKRTIKRTFTGLNLSGLNHLGLYFVSPIIIFKKCFCLKITNMWFNFGLIPRYHHLLYGSMNCFALMNRSINVQVEEARSTILFANIYSNLERIV